jgi:hypothetical protein
MRCERWEHISPLTEHFLSSGRERRRRRVTSSPRALTRSVSHLPGSAHAVERAVFLPASEAGFHDPDQRAS